MKSRRTLSSFAPSMERLETRDLLSGLSCFPRAEGYGAQATGGRGGPVVVAQTAAQFRSFAQQAGPQIIWVQGMLDVGYVSVRSNKTIVGDGNDGLIGELHLNGVSNVILQNLSINNRNGVGGGDALRLTRATRVWIDHVNVTDAPDGLIDITTQSDNVTVSWAKISYSASDPPEHNFAMLIGGSDTDIGDRGKLHVTLHHNWWGSRIKERMPRARFGDVHVFNNYFNSPGNNYVMRAAIESELLVENNYFEGVRDPHVVYVTTGTRGRIEARGNVYVSTTGRRDGGSDVFNPPYAYSLHSGSSVRSVVRSGAGVKTLPAGCGVSAPGGSQPGDDGSGQADGETGALAPDQLVVEALGRRITNFSPPTTLTSGVNSVREAPNVVIPATLPLSSTALAFGSTTAEATAPLERLFGGPDPDLAGDWALALPAFPTEKMSSWMN